MFEMSSLNIMPGDYPYHKIVVSAADPGTVEIQVFEFIVDPSAQNCRGHFESSVPVKVGIEALAHHLVALDLEQSHILEEEALVNG